MRPFTEAEKYNFPLNPRSLCIDVGAYHGDWSREMSDKYHCRIDAYEPIKRFYDSTAKRLQFLEKVRVYNLGVGALSGAQTMGVQNDSSGAFSGSQEVELCQVIAIAKAVKVAAVRFVDVLKLNCEGSEFAILHELLTTKDEFGQAIERFRHIMVQFHQCVQAFEEKYNAIAGDLAQTHELIWREPFVWECWRLKQPAAG